MIIVPIHSTHTEEFPVGNCHFSMKIKEGEWACLSKEEYILISQQKEERAIQEMKAYKESPLSTIGIASIIILVIGGIIVGKKLDWGTAIFLGFIGLMFASIVNLILFMCVNGFR